MPIIRITFDFPVQNDIERVCVVVFGAEAFLCLSGGCSSATFQIQNSIESNPVTHFDLDAIPTKMTAVKLKTVMNPGETRCRKGNLPVRYLC